MNEEDPNVLSQWTWDLLQMCQAAKKLPVCFHINFYRFLKAMQAQGTTMPEGPINEVGLKAQAHYATYRNLPVFHMAIHGVALRYCDSKETVLTGPIENK